MKKTFLLLSLLLFSPLFAFDYVLINSEKEIDVLSGISYANLIGVDFSFLPKNDFPKEILLQRVEGKDVLLITSDSVPVDPSFRQELTNVKSLEDYVSVDPFLTNYHFAKVSGADSFVVVDPNHLDYAVSAIPFAKAENSYILFVDKDHKSKALEILSSTSKIYVYGYLDPDVKSSIDAFSPIYLGTGEDRYEDNVFLVNKLMEDHGFKQVIMYNGRYVEKSTAEGDYPILFIGDKLIPESVKSFIKESVSLGKLKVAVLIDANDTVLVNSFRKSLNSELESSGSDKRFGVILKLGMTRGGEDVIPLDVFPISSVFPVLSISDVSYDDANGKLVIILDNSGDIPTYFIVDVSVLSDGKKLMAFGTNDSDVVLPGEKKGLEFPLNLSDVEASNISASVLVRFGSGKSTLESFVNGVYPLVEKEFVDKTEIEATRASYDSKEHRLYVNVRNVGEQKAFFKSSVVLFKEGNPIELKKNSTLSIEPGIEIVVDFPVVLSVQDLLDNEEVNVVLNYGAIEGLLKKTGEFSLPIESGKFVVETNSSNDSGGQSWIFMFGVFTIVLVVFAILAFLLLGEKKNRKKRR